MGVFRINYTIVDHIFAVTFAGREFCVLKKQNKTKTQKGSFALLTRNIGAKSHKYHYDYITIPSFDKGSRCKSLQCKKFPISKIKLVIGRICCLTASIDGKCLTLSRRCSVFEKHYFLLLTFFIFYKNVNALITNSVDPQVVFRSRTVWVNFQNLKFFQPELSYSWIQGSLR